MALFGVFRAVFRISEPRGTYKNPPTVLWQEEGSGCPVIKIKKVNTFNYD